VTFACTGGCRALSSRCLIERRTSRCNFDNRATILNTLLARIIEGGRASGRKSAFELMMAAGSLNRLGMAAPETRQGSQDLRAASHCVYFPLHGKVKTSPLHGGRRVTPDGSVQPVART
jgi:hypothetical protein